MLNKAKVLGIILALVFLAIALWKVDITELGQTLATADYRFLLPAASATLLGYICRTYRWKRILAPARGVPLRRLFPVLMIGFMANNVLPARVGEFVRAYTLSRGEGVTKSFGLATIFVERLCDGLTLVLFLGVLSLVFPLPSWGTEAAYIASALFLGVAVFILALLVRENLITAIIRMVAAAAYLASVRFLSVAAFILALLRREDLVTRMVARPFRDRFEAWLLSKASFFVEGLRALQRRRAVLRIIASSLVVWGLEATSYYLVIRGFSVQLSDISLVLAAILMLVMVNLGAMLPSAPGYVGTFQFFGVLALSAFGVKREVALSIAVISHTMQYLLVTSIGLYFFWKHNLSLRRISEDAIQLAD